MPIDVKATKYCIGYTFVRETLDTNNVIVPICKLLLYLSKHILCIKCSCKNTVYYF